MADKIMCAIRIDTSARRAPGDTMSKQCAAA